MILDRLDQILKIKSQFTGCDIQECIHSFMDAHFPMIVNGKNIFWASVSHMMDVESVLKWFGHYLKIACLYSNSIYGINTELQ